MIDLHLHTNASDGSLRPADLVARAAGAGLVTISVTDHDTTASVDEVVVADVDAARAAKVASAVGLSARAVPADADDAFAGCDALVVATPAPHAPTAERWLRREVPVVSCSDDADDVWDLVRLGVLADDHGVTLLVGTAFAPGFTCLLARYAAQLDPATALRLRRYSFMACRRC